MLRAVVTVVGLGITALSMSAGFVWAVRGEVLFEYAAGFAAWTCHLVVHDAAVVTSSTTSISGGQRPRKSLK